MHLFKLHLFKLPYRLENGHQGQIHSKWPKLSRNPVEKAILEGSWGTRAGSAANGLIGSDIIGKAFWSTWPHLASGG